MPPVTVAIAGPDQKRAACLRLLRPQKGIQVLGEARSGLEALAVARLKPRVLLLDASLSRGKSSALIPAVRRSSPGTKVIVIGSGVSESQILDALGRGAQGYLDKKVLRGFLTKAVKVVDAGQAWVSRKLVPEIVERLTRLAPAA